MNSNDDGLFARTVVEDMAEIDPVGVLQALLRLCS
jgi:hypothetical protein